MKRLLAPTILLALATASAHAETLAPVSSFGQNGLIRFSAAPLSGNIPSPHLALGTDGSLFIGVTSELGVSNDFMLTKFNNGGTLDTAFGSSGFVTTVASGDDSLDALTRVSDGVIAAGSTTSGAVTDTVLVKYRFDGSVDPAFGSAGRLVLDLGVADGHLLALKADSQGRLLMFAKNEVRRYFADGSQDLTFGTSGMVTGPSTGGFGALLLDSSDNFYLAQGSRVARFLNDGTPDATFGTSGVVTLPDFVATQACFDANGNLIISGTVFIVGTFNYKAALARVSGGAMDTTFGTNGVVTSSYTSSVSLDVLPDASGNLLWGIRVAATETIDGIVRIGSDGSVDTTFDTDGMYELPSVGAQHYFLRAIVARGDGSYYAVGGYMDGSYLTATGDQKAAVQLLSTATGTNTNTTTGGGDANTGGNDDTSSASNNVAGGGGGSIGWMLPLMLLAGLGARHLRGYRGTELSR